MARKPKDAELNALSKQYKIQYKTLKEIRDKYEKRDDWFDTFCENPYFLTKFPRWGFFRCDLYAQKIGFDMNSDERMLASVRHIIEEKSDGNTILQIKTVLEGMIKLLKRKDTSYMVDVIKRKHKELGYVLYDKDIKVTEESNAMYITLVEWRDIERNIYQLCKNSEKYQMKDKEFIDKALDKIEAGLEFPLNEKQKQAFFKIPHGKVNVLTGLGGSGKSYTTRAVLDVLDELGETYTLLAPTGTAVKVLSNSTKRSAMTIHRRFHIDQEKIFDDWLIVDESSMLSLEHFNLLLQRLSECPIKLLLIGDINQLVSIGVGTPFRDIISMIETGAIEGNVVHLTEIMRSKKDSAISHVCKMFTEYGEFNRSELYKELKGVDFIPLNKENFKLQIEGLIKAREFKMIDTFVLSPFNVREFGTNIVNNHIQKVFNKGNVCYKDDLKQYKIGDYLMHTKNNAKMDIFNGERIRLVGSQKCIDDDGREVTEYVCQKVDDNVMLRYDEETLRKETMLSYAISIHKSQGASLNNTILVLDSSHFISLSRNSVYTGMSRASKNLIVLYDEKALNIASKKNEVQKRKTFLREMSERRRKQK